MRKGTAHCTEQMTLANVDIDLGLASESRTTSQQIQLLWD